ncbi:MAG: hypothetical protein ACYC1L_11200 [Alphaproteobacteria bacterium]
MMIRMRMVAACAAAMLTFADAWAAPAKLQNIDKEDAFLDWAAEKPVVAEMSVQEPGVVWVALKPEAYKSPDNVRKLARELACGYDRIVKFKGAVVTVWPETGTGGSFVAREQCK